MCTNHVVSRESFKYIKNSRKVTANIVTEKKEKMYHFQNLQKKNQTRLKDTVVETFLRLLMKYDAAWIFNVLFLTTILIKGLS